MPERVVFDATHNEHKWALKELNPDLPADWTGFDYLVLELRASSPQRFSLALQSDTLVQSRQVHPLANVWIRAAYACSITGSRTGPGSILASVGKVARNSFWISTWWRLWAAGPSNPNRREHANAAGESDDRNPIGHAGQRGSGLRHP